mmetsp:Transcript_17269/g.21104  ORF Transcript_17269/g.21104 Transcript_17269/m.21104 type:complete len:136 (-) Transcript_17269:125-532(-)
MFSDVAGVSFLLSSQEIWNTLEIFQSLFRHHVQIEIGYMPFSDCPKLLIFQVPQHTEFGYLILGTTTDLFKASPFGPTPPHDFDTGYYDEATAWIKNVNGDSEEYALHRACCCFNPMTDIIHDVVRRQGLRSFKK